MKYIKCINPLVINLTYGKIYEVISLSTSDWSNVTYVRILNNNGVEVTYIYHHQLVIYQKNGLKMPQQK